MKVHTEKSIAVPFESWFFLKKEEYRQRSEHGRQLTEKRWKDVFYSVADKKGVSGAVKYIKSGDFGGCNGSPVHAWEEHRWTYWTLDEIKAMLDKAGLPYSEGEDIEYFDVPL